MNQNELLTRKEAVAIVGADCVDALDSVNCEATGRLMLFGGEVEFSASIAIDNSDYDCLAVFYYQDESDVNPCEDLSNLDWEPAGYRFI